MRVNFFQNNNIVYTAGYQGKDIDEFLDHLVNHNIQQVVDVREIPFSRKKGFSKKQLRQRLEEYNITYVHVKALGSPSPLRKKLYQDKDFDYFFEQYEKYLEECQRELENLYETVRTKISCLLCFENSHSSCHRSSVANKISELNGTPFQIKHI